MESEERGLFLQKDDRSPLVIWSDVPAALGLLTRLPIKVNAEAAMQRGAASAWAYPLVGLVVAAVTLLIIAAVDWLGLGSLTLAVICLAVPIILTGAMHEDGLADSADGLWGGWDKARRLEIMKDSQIGTYGVLALGLILLFKFSALSTLMLHDYFWAAVIVSATVSRAAMLVLMTLMPNARDGGLSRSVGRPSHSTMLLGCGLAIAVSFILAPWQAPAVLITVAVGTLACAAIANTKISGQTGDILGATQQITEALALLAFVAIS